MKNAKRTSKVVVLLGVAVVMGWIGMELQAAPPPPAHRPHAVAPRPAVVARLHRPNYTPPVKLKKVPTVLESAGSTSVVITTGGTSDGTGSSGTTGTTAQTVSETTAGATSSNTAATQTTPDDASSDFAGATSYKVLRIEDAGLTAVLDVEGKECRVRMLGLAAVPAQKKEGPVSAKANPAAQKFTEGLLKGESVYVVYDSTLEEKDEDGNYVAYLYRAPDGLCINIEMIRQGYAAAAASYSYEQQDTFKVYQLRASESSKGLWGQSAAAPAQTDQTSTTKLATVQGAAK
ncbi:MAG: thermonuclease family protein [Planctomycetes bacterium]|nr:thermonuclease family protein [Planctomycetota bacterium]